MTALKRSRGLVAWLMVGLLGVAAELMLLEHYEEIWQWSPFVALGMAAAAATAELYWQTETSRRWLRAASCVLLLAGLVGLIKHFQGNLEFELEIYPDLAGIDLLWRAAKGATPALAPGFVSFLGGLGLLATPKPLDSSPPLR